jgi:dTDP-4-dehydrorhamnose reductase
LREKKIKIFIHIAALSRPMEIHDKKIDLSIQTNIIGTANVVRACSKLKIKLIYFSTNYVYPCKRGNYKETDPLMPINNYGWSKLGGECAVQMLKDSLILRLALTDFPFGYKKAIKNAYSSFIFNKDFAKILPSIN